jgi:gliding motility-associated-like protein
MKFLRTFSNWILLLLAALTLSTQAKALAVGSGGELRYEYINDSTYRFFYKFYRSCSGIPEPDAVSLCYRNTTCGGVWYTERLQKMIVAPDGEINGQPIDSGCEGQPTTCTDPNATTEMYRAWWYSGIVKIGPCDKWLFSVNISERDRTTLTNLNIMPAWDHNLYVEAVINNLNGYARKQSSPRFTVQPPVYVCDGQPFHYNNGVVDPDGDSLVYKIIQPRSATTDMFVICAGYPPVNLAFSSPAFNITNNPLETNNTFNINASNGDINFTPVGNQVAYICYLVEKYRNGHFIGSVTRDSRFQVRACTTPPINFQLNASSVQGATLTNDTLVICSNNEVNFCFNANTTVSGTRLILKDNSEAALRGATVTYTNLSTNSVTGCVNWTPEVSDIGFRYLVVYVKDSTCTPTSSPIVQAYKIPILVKQGVEVIAKDTLVCEGSSLKVYAVGGSNFTWSAGPNAATFSCSPCDTTMVTPSDTTYIKVTTSLNNGCNNKDSIRVYIDRSTKINAFPDTIVLCNGGEYVTLNALASGLKPLKTVVCGTYSGVSNENLINIESAQNSNNTYINEMYNNYVRFYGPFYQYFGTQKMQILYRKEELQELGITPGTIQKIGLNFKDYNGGNVTYNNVKISLRCTEKQEFVTLYHSEFELGLAEVFSAPSVTIQPGWNEFSFNTPYDYDTSKNLVVQFCYSGVSPQADNNNSLMPIYYISTVYKSSIAAGQTFASNACASNLGTVVTYNRRPDTRFTISQMPSMEFPYSWTPALAMDNPHAATTGVYADSTRWYKVTTKGRTGCEVSDSILVYVANNNFNIYPTRQVVCDGDVARFTGYNGYQFNWFTPEYTLPEGFSCTTCKDPDVSQPIGHYNYQVIASDYYGCSDTLSAELYVNPKPATNIITQDTTILYGQSVQLEAEGANHYVWSPINTLNNHKIANPIASPTESTLYIVSGYAEEGCVIQDSVWVKVLTLGEPYIPNAFSPNGDGLNDFFRLEYLQNLKLLSFKIFNRFGEMVFDGGSSNIGWDGNYKGTAAALGTYYYYIQVVLRDGTLKNYKGDITLIR